MIKYTYYIVFFFLFLSCKDENKKSLTSNPLNISEKKDAAKEHTFLQNRDSTIFIPKFAQILPQYEKNNSLNRKLKYKVNKIRKIVGSSDDEFLDNMGDESDITPDIDYGNFVVEVTEKQKKLIYLKTKKISKEYFFYFIKNKLLLVTEKYKTTDSIFFENNHIILWKNSSNKFVNNFKTIKGKENYILRLVKEMKEIENNEIGYIEKYNYVKDSLSSFVIANLKK